MNIGLQAALRLHKMPGPLPHCIPLVAVAKGVDIPRRAPPQFSNMSHAKRLLSGAFGLTHKI
jgi:hypothetical protein